MYPNAYDFLSRSYQFAALLDGVIEVPLPPRISGAQLHKHLTGYMFPQFDPYTFARSCSVLDQAVGYTKSTTYPPSMLAAAIFAKSYSMPSTTSSSCSSNILFLATGYKHHQLTECLAFLDHLQEDDVLALLETMHDAIQSCRDYGMSFDIREHQIKPAGVLLEQQAHA